jgi:hypothetical protein
MFIQQVLHAQREPSALPNPHSNPVKDAVRTEDTDSYHSLLCFIDSVLGVLGDGDRMVTGAIPRGQETFYS